MKKHVVIYNTKEVKKYVEDISVSIKENDISRWILSNFYNYLVNDYKKFQEMFPEQFDYDNETLTIQKAIENEEKIVSIKLTTKLTTKLKRDVEHIIDYLKSNKSPKNIFRLSFKDAMEHSKQWTKDLNNEKMESETIDLDSLNIIHKLSDDYFIVQLETRDEFNLEGKDMNHCVLDYYDRYKNNSNFVIWSIRNKLNKPTATVEILFGSYCNGITIPQFKGRFNRGMIDRDAARLFYDYLQKTYNYVNFQDQSAFGNGYYDERVKKNIPLTLWEDGGVIKELYLEDQYISQLPKNLKVLGNLNITNTQICFLGEGLEVVGNIYASGSQLAVIDDTVKVGGRINATNTLLMSYPEELKDKINKNKNIYISNANKYIKLN